MRIIGQIDHPTLKISVFKNENRTFLKIENGVSEITWKLGDDDRFKTTEAVQKLIDPPFLQEVDRQFQQMHATRLAAMSRLFPVLSGSEFETII